jgi:phosphoglucosamine mutase
VERRLDNEGRVLVRYSGTEPICRIMVEGQSTDKTRIYCQELADVIKKNIGKK